MKPITEVYPDSFKYHYDAPSDYGPLLESIASVELRMDEHGYQGSSYVLYRDGVRWGYLTFGWGSCSGCDALQHSQSFEEVEELRTDLVNRIQWRNTLQEIVQYLDAAEEAGRWEATADDFLKFRDRVRWMVKS